MLKLQIFVFNPFSENTYLLWDEASGDGAVIDPGCSIEAEEKQLADFIEDKGIKLKYLLNTHCHIDHIFGNPFIKDNYSVEFVIPEKDEFLFELAQEQANMFGVNLNPMPKPDSYFSEDRKLFLGKEELSFLFTPGHTPGEYSIYDKNGKRCFTGDVLFLEGVGRTDLWGGDYNTLMNSIKTKLFALPGEVTVYPGHGPESSINYEIKNNPYMREA